MEVEKAGFARVDGFAQVGVGLVGGAEADGFSFCERPVKGRAGGCAGDDADLKGAVGGVFHLGTLSDGGRDFLG